MFLLLALNALSSNDSRADWVILPESRHHLYETFGSYFDQQSTLTFYGAQRIWSSLGGTLPIYGNESAQNHPQFVIHGTANAALHYNESFRIWTETVDARVGASFEMAIDPTMRFSVGVTHLSGHAADGVQDFTLFEPTLGEEIVPMRFVYDSGNHFRFGGTFKPFIRSFPSVKFLSADQFIEIFPWGTSDDPHHPTFFGAMGVDETGIDHYFFTFHLQAGAYFGNHFLPHFQKTVRTVAGYYNGADPRLKYFQFKRATLDFLYLGFMFDI